MKTFKNRFEWHKDMKENINRVLCQAYPRHWEEDYLTRAILVELKKLYKDVKISSDKISSKNIKFSWDVFKNTKQFRVEQKYGDIGILLQILFSKNKILEGVAFLEAKKIYEKSQKYDALDFQQLQRFVAYSTNHRTIFYDFRDCANGGAASALGLPTQHLLTIRDKSRGLYQYCEYYSYILTNRYLQGYELDYSIDVVKELKGLLETKGGVDYLIVAQMTDDPDLSLNIEQIEINKKKYEKLISTESDNTLNQG